MFGSTNFSMLWEHKKKAAPANAWVSAVFVLVHQPHFSWSDSALARCSRTWKATFSRRARAEVPVRLQGMTLAAAGVLRGELLISTAHGGVLHS
jgi:hypothetical protein